MKGRVLAFAIGLVVASAVAALVASSTDDPTTQAPLRSPAPGAAEAPRAPAPTPAGLAELRARLAEVERRLADSERKLVTFQVFVNKITQEGGAPRENVATAPGESTDQATERPALPSRDSKLSVGTPRNGVLALLGKPDEEEVDAEYGSTLKYYELGLRIELDASSNLERAVFFGKPTGDGGPDANGNISGLFEKDGKWYRGAAWGLHGVRIGMTGQQVIAKLGYPPDLPPIPDANGNYVLYYEDKGLVLYLADEDEGYRLRGFRLGGGPPQPDANGNVY